MILGFNKILDFRFHIWLVYISVGYGGSIMLDMVDP